MTGIEGVYDFNLYFASETDADMTGPAPRGPEGAQVQIDPAPPLFDAVQQ